MSRAHTAGFCPCPRPWQAETRRRHRRPDIPANGAQPARAVGPVEGAEPRVGRWPSQAPVPARPGARFLCLFERVSCTVGSPPVPEATHCRWSGDTPPSHGLGQDCPARQGTFPVIASRAVGNNNRRKLSMVSFPQRSSPAYRWRAPAPRRRPASARRPGSRQCVTPIGLLTHSRQHPRASGAPQRPGFPMPVVPPPTGASSVRNQD